MFALISSHVDEFPAIVLKCWICHFMMDISSLWNPSQSQEHAHTHTHTCTADQHLNFKEI